MLVKTMRAQSTKPLGTSSSGLGRQGVGLGWNSRNILQVQMVSTWLKSQDKCNVLQMCKSIHRKGVSWYILVVGHDVACFHQVRSNGQCCKRRATFLNLHGHIWGTAPLFSTKWHPWNGIHRHSEGQQLGGEGNKMGTGWGWGVGGCAEAGERG